MSQLKKEKNKKKFNYVLFYSILGIFGLIMVFPIYLYKDDEYEFLLDDSNVVLDLGSTYQIKIRPKHTINYEITNYKYESENPNVVSVTKGGTITSVGTGTTNIIIKSKDGKNEKKLTVTSENIDVTTLNMETIDTLSVNESAVITTTANNKDNIIPNVVYDSDNQSVLMVDEYGNINAIKEGEAVVSAMASNGVVAKTKIIVNPAKEDDLNKIIDSIEENRFISIGDDENNNINNENIENNNESNLKNNNSIKLNISSTTLKVGDNLYLKASTNSKDTLAINWVSSDETIAKVDNNGKVIALKEGNVTIQAMSLDGRKAVCDIVIKAKNSSRLRPAIASITNALYKTLVTKEEPNGTCEAVIKGDETTVTVNSISKVVGYNYNGVQTTSNVYKVSENWNDASVVLLGENGVSSRINCNVVYVAMPEYSYRAGTQYKKYEASTDTLKVQMRKDGAMLLTYIWAYNPNEQLFKRYTVNDKTKNQKPKFILKKAVNENNLKDKLVVGFNSSVPVGKDGSETFMKYFYKRANYRYLEPSPLMIANGAVLLNDPNQAYGSKKNPCSNFLQLYWIDRDNNLNATPKYLCKYTAAEREQIFNAVIASGARNTMIFRPLLVYNGQAVKLGKSFLKSADKKKQVKQALCQVDSNNFILVSGKKYYKNLGNYLVGLGCKTAVEFDAGHSTAVLFKKTGTVTPNVVYGGGRKLTMVTYFTEL